MFNDCLWLLGTGLSTDTYEAFLWQKRVATDQRRAAMHVIFFAINCNYSHYDYTQLVCLPNQFVIQ